MSHFPIAETLDLAIEQARRSQRDELGYFFHTFRIEIADSDENGHDILSRLVDESWQLQGGPVIIAASGDSPRHIILSMLHAQPRPLRIRGEMRLHAEVRGEIDGELRGL